MNRAGQILYSVTRNKCPRCLEGEFFYGKWYNLRGFVKMHNQCPKCGLDYRQEPGFYFGATYVSYGFQVLLFALSYFVLYIWLDVSFTVYLTTIIVLLILLVPLTFRLARLGWINLMGRYEPKKD
jgi:uncharacterized protein (DUF983 family)